MQKKERCKMTRYDVIISPIDSPLEQLTIEVDAIGAKTAEQLAQSFFPTMAILNVSPHKEPVQIKPTLKDKIEWTVRRLKNG